MDNLVIEDLENIANDYEDSPPTARMMEKNQSHVVENSANRLNLGNDIELATIQQNSNDEPNYFYKNKASFQD